MQTTRWPFLTAVPPIICGPLFVGLFMWLAVALGFRILRLLRIRSRSFEPWERGLVCAALGAGCLQYLPYGLNVLGRMTPVTVRLGLGLIALLLVPDLAHVARRVPVTLAQSRSSSTRAVAAWLSLLALYLAILLVHAVVLGMLGDDDGYHLMAPRRWLEAGALTYLPTYTHTNAPMGFEMLYVIALASWGVVGAKLLHYWAGACCLFGLYLSARRLSGQLAGIVAVSLLLLVPNPISELPFLMAMAYNDLGVCWMTMTSILVWLVWRQRRDDALLRCSALCAGFAGSFKFTALSVGIGWAVLLLDGSSRREVLRNIVALIRRYGVFLLAPISPWLYRNWALTGNPIYPMFPGLIPTRDWSLEQGRVFTLFFRYYNWGKRYGARLGEPRRKEILVASAVCLLILFGMAIVRTRRDECRRVLALAAVVLAATLPLTGLYFRFWLPGIMCICLVLGSLFAARWSTRRWAPWLALALLIVALPLMLRIDPNHRLGFRDDLRIAVGRRSLDEQYRNDPFWNAWAYLDANTSKESHVLAAAFYPTFGASSGGMFWVDRASYATDGHLEGYFHFGDWPSFVESIHRARIDYVVILDQQFAADRYGFTFVAGTNEYPFCRRLVEEHGDIVYQYNHLQIYRLRSI